MIKENPNALYTSHVWFDVLVVVVIIIALNALKFDMKLKQLIKRFLIKNHDRRILRLK